MNKKLIVILAVIFFIAIVQDSQKSCNSCQQTIVPNVLEGGCFTKEDCAVPVSPGYCGVDYSCIIGKCYYTNIKCPEDCSSIGDEDMDGLLDCDDPDCWSSPYCHCSTVEYNICKAGQCYCEPGTSPQWFVTSESNYCYCS